MRFRALLLLLPITIAMPISADDAISSYLFRDIAAPQLQKNNSALMTAIDTESVAEAASLNKLLIETATSDQTIDALSYARALSNAAVVEAMLGDRSSSMQKSSQATELIEVFDPYHPDLFNILMVKSHTYHAEDMFAEAEDSLRRAQHILHRLDGVYSRRQLPVIEAIAAIKMAQGKSLAADSEQRFNLKVSERVFGVASEELIPTLNRLGTYFANRGGSIPLNTFQDERLYRDRLFRLSTQMFERSITIIEDKYGETDLRLVDSLKGLARTKFKRGLGRVNAERPMERAMDIVLSNPGTDKADHAKAMVALADLYTTTSDSRARDLYLKAWAHLDGDEAQEALRYELFARPKRLIPEVPIQPVLFRHPVAVEKGSELFVDITFDIREDGRIRNATVVGGNVPNSDRKLMRDFVSSMRYRPRIVDGQIETTVGMSLHQNYLYKERDPQTSISFSTGAGPR